MSAKQLLPDADTQHRLFQVADDGIQITFSDTFVDAMSGKIYSYYTQKIEEMMGGSQ